MQQSLFKSFFIMLLLFAVIAGYSQQFNYYFGNIHAHTGFSDGNKDGNKTNVKDPTGSFAFASKSKNFDFLGISEHNHSQAGMNKPDFAKGVTQANKSNKNGSFVFLYGMEFGVISNGGHVLVYGINELLGWEANNFDIECEKSDYGSLWSIINDHPGAFAT